MADIDLATWRLIGGGSERKCYQDPQDPARLIKVSPKQDAKQTLREIEYYRYLMDHKVPFDHIPLFYGKFEQDGLIGIEQELILDSPGSTEPAQHLHKYLDQPLSDAQIAGLHQAFAKFKDYLMKWDIVISDLQLSNVVVHKNGDSIHLVMIDGLGSTELIPVSRWFKRICRQKTDRHWAKFCRKITRENPNITF